LGSLPTGTDGWYYDLRELTADLPLDKSEIDEELLIYLDYHEYDVPPRNGPSHFFEALEYFGAGARFDLGPGAYLSLRLMELPMIGGHPVITGTGGIDWLGAGLWWGGSVIYSPSIAGFFNVYGGLAWVVCSNCTQGAGAGPEAGVKFRVPIPKAPSPEFFGIRIGLRYPNFVPLRGGRLFLEIGRATP
jgi:hypothetical protein